LSGARHALGVMPILVSLQIGRAANYPHVGAGDGRPGTWRTAFFKSPVSGSVFVGEFGLAGDEQADRENHGGLEKAVLAYSADHYAWWRSQIGLPDMPAGAFGENLTIAGLDEASVCVGDRWQAAGVVLEVSQPRQPCWKLGRRWQNVDLPRQVIQNGKSGWYLRVVKEGELIAGTSLELIARPHADWTIARANRLFYHERQDVAGLLELAHVAALSAAWREGILQRVAERQR
jgi:MOSC domain-containing protein YiiM